jgi:hypothetical protein
MTSWKPGDLAWYCTQHDREAVRVVDEPLGSFAPSVWVDAGGSPGSFADAVWEGDRPGWVYPRCLTRLTPEELAALQLGTLAGGGL